MNRLLYVALAHDYGELVRGRAYEHWNFYEPLRRICTEQGWEMLHFCPAEDLRGPSHGSLTEMNRRLLQLVSEWQPDAMFHVPYQGEVTPDTIRMIRYLHDVWTIGWFCDDAWRFDGFTQKYCAVNAFDRYVTAYSGALGKYMYAIPPELWKHSGTGITPPRAVLSQFAADTELLMSPVSKDKFFDVSFIGMPHGDRVMLLQQTKASLDEHAEEALGRQVKMSVHGIGWSTGRLTQGAVLRLIGASRIVLNLTNASTKDGTGARPQQMKGRHFEIAARGAFQLTQPVEDLDTFFVTSGENAEIAVTEAITGEHLAQDIIEWLRPEKEDEREAIARRGRARVLRDHRWEQRLLPLLEEVPPRMQTTFSIATSSMVEYEAFPETAIMVLNWNGKDVIMNCLHSIEQNTDCPWRLILGDNASEDGSLEMVAEWAAANGVKDRTKIIRFPTNLGPAEGRHRLLGYLRTWEASEHRKPAQYVCFLDNDTMVPPGWLRHMIDSVEDLGPHVGVAGPMTNTAAGPQRIALEGYCGSWGGAPDDLWKQDKNWRLHMQGQMTQVGRLISFCLLIRRKALDMVGSIDPRFGLYGFEDDDLVWRIRLADWSAIILNDSFVYHRGQFGGARTQEDLEALLETSWQKFRDKWMLPEGMSHRVYTDLATRFQLGRPWIHTQDYISPFETKETQI